MTLFIVDPVGEAQRLHACAARDDGRRVLKLKRRECFLDAPPHLFRLRHGSGRVTDVLRARLVASLITVRPVDLAHEVVQVIGSALHINKQRCGRFGVRPAASAFLFRVGLNSDAADERE